MSSFNCKDKPRISRFPDKKDCSKFIYCVSGTPHSAKCWPEGARFNPVSTRCDLPPTASCGPISTTTRPHPSLLPIPVQIRPNVPVQVDVTPIISTTPTTTTVAPTTPKPEHLMDMFSFDLDCGRTHPCGLYPNHKGKGLIGQLIRKLLNLIFLHLQVTVPLSFYALKMETQLPSGVMVDKILTQLLKNAVPQRKQHVGKNLTTVPIH